MKNSAAMHHNKVQKQLTPTRILKPRILSMLNDTGMPTQVEAKTKHRCKNFTIDQSFGGLFSASLFGRIPHKHTPTHPSYRHPHSEDTPI